MWVKTHTTTPLCPPDECVLLPMRSPVAASSGPLIVLGSRSPRRRELLSLLVPAERIVVLPPTDPDEPGFEGLVDEASIRRQLLHIAHLKNTHVRARQECPPEALVLTADTIIVAGEPGAYVVLGQPPATPEWQQTVREWFHSHYFGRTHRALTAVVLSHPDGQLIERIVETHVTLGPENVALLEWYLATEEPLGKAGGYALQGAGSVFVSRVEGSLTNVVGLPLEAVREMLAEMASTTRE